MKCVKENLKQYIGFGVVGVSNTLISLGVYYALIAIGVNYLLSNFFGFFVSILNAYYWNRRYVFKTTEIPVLKSLIKVYISYAFTLAVGMGTLIFWVDILEISKLVAPILNLAVTVPLSFILNKYWAFNTKLEKTNE